MGARSLLANLERKTMTALWDYKIVKISAIISPWLLLLFNTVSDDFSKSDIQVSLNPVSNGNLTTAKITISNTGTEPATNLRITFNPLNDIVSNKTSFYTEEIKFESTGSRNLIGLMDRLANGHKIVVDTTLNVPIEQFRNYIVFVAHDAGGTTYHYKTTAEFPFVLQLTLSISWVIVMSIVLLQRFGFLNNLKTIFEKSKQSKKSIDIARVKSEIVAEIPPEPFLKISLTNNEYHTGDLIQAKLSFSGLSVGETIWIGIFNPQDKEIATKRLKVKKAKGETIVDLLTIEDWDKNGEYVVKTDTQFGPESSTRFQFTK